MASGAALGVALDGDADRVLAVDHTGELVDGDQLLAMFAFDLLERGLLTGGSIVVTVMSNLGLRQALAARGIGVVETPVGDRYVSDAIEANGLQLGGEQSGHLVFRRHGMTGDGILTALLAHRARRPAQAPARRAGSRGDDAPASGASQRARCRPVTPRSCRVPYGTRSRSSSPSSATTAACCCGRRGQRRSCGSWRRRRRTSWPRRGRPARHGRASRA